MIKPREADMAKEEYRRRLQPAPRAPRTPLATIEAQLGKLRQGVGRVIESYADGLIDKGEFEPRILRLRQRMARLEEQRQQLAEEATLQTELQLIIGRLEDFAAKVHDGLEEADWASKRDVIRTLVKRVEVARDQVNIVFRIDPYSSDADPEKKVCNFVGGVLSPRLATVALDGMERWFDAAYADGRPRHCAAKHVCQKVRHAQWQMLWTWAQCRHPNTRRKWVTARSCRSDGDWTFGAGKAALVKPDATPRTRFTTVPGRNSPSDPALRQYWRERKQHQVGREPYEKQRLRLPQKQG